MNLENVLEYETRKPQLTVIESKDTDGSFLIHHLLSTLLRKTDQPGVLFLLTLSQTLSHYKSVQAKLGNSTVFGNALNSASLVPIDLMGPISSAETTHRNVFDAVITDMRAKLESRSTHQPICVVIDDLSLASLVGLDDLSVLRFLRQIQSLNDHDKSSLIVYAQSFDSNKSLVNDLIHVSDLVVRVERLSTGYSKEIDGQVSKGFLP